MPYITLSDLRDRILKRSDMSNSGFVSTSELDSYINTSLGGLTDILSEENDEFSLKTFSFTTGLSNLLLQSDNLEEEEWVQTNIAVNSDNVRDHEGDFNSADLVPDATSGLHNIIQTVAAASFTDDEDYTFSVRAKAGSGSNTVQLAFTGDGSGSVIFDVSAGTFVQTGSIVKVFMREEEDSWWRIGISFDAGSSTNALKIACVSGASTLTFSGTASTIYTYITEPQLTQGVGLRTYLLTTTSSAASSSDVYNLPEDLQTLKGVDRVYSSTESETLLPFNWNNRNRYKSPYNYLYSNISNYRYRWMGEQIHISPTPTSGKTFKIWYHPLPRELVADSDSWNFRNRYEEWLILDCVIKCLQKEETSAAHLVKERDKIEERIRNSIGDRDSQFSTTVTDVTRMNYGEYGYGDGRGW